MDIHGAEGNIAHALNAHHHHAGHPEEENVEARDQQCVGIELLQVSRFLRPSQRGEWPQGGAEPGVQNVGILGDVATAAMLTLVRIFHAHRNAVAFMAMPRGDAVAPPQLAADAPVPHVPHPVVVDLRPVIRNEDRASLLNRLNGLIRKRACAHKPLGGNHRLHHHTRALAFAHAQFIGFRAIQEALRFHIRQHFFPGFVAVKPCIRPAFAGDLCVLVNHPDQRQVVPHRRFKVIRVMCRSDLYAARAKLRICHLIQNDGNLALHQRQHHALAVEVRIPRVHRVDGHGGVTQHRLRTGGGNHYVIIRILHWIAEVPELPFHLLVNHFKVTEGRLELGVPIHHVGSPVNQALAVEVHEHRAHCPRQALIQREARPRPVDAFANPRHLLQNCAAVQFLVFPNLRLKRFAAQALAGDAVFSEFAFHHHLGSDAGVVRSRKPQRIAPLHPVPAGGDVNL